MAQWEIGGWESQVAASVSLPSSFSPEKAGPNVDDIGVWKGGLPCTDRPPSLNPPSLRCGGLQLWIRNLSPGARSFLEPSTSSPLSPAPLSGKDRCEELAVGTKAVTGTGTKEGDRV